MVPLARLPIPFTLMKTEPLNLNAINVFCRVAEQKTISRAAQSLGITPSAVSQTLAKLEADLGVALFERGARPLVLTPEGKLLRERGLVLLNDAEELKKRLTSRTLASRHLRVGLSESVSATISPWVIRALSEKVQTLSARTLLTKPLYEALREGELDVAILPDGRLTEDRWERRALYEERFLLIRGKGLGPIHGVEDGVVLREHPFIGYDRAESSDQMEMERILRRFNWQPKVRVPVASSYALVGLVAELNGWSVVPATNIWCGRQFAQAVTIQTIPGNASHVRTMWALCDAAHLTQTTQWVADVVSEVMQNHMLPELARVSPLLKASVRLLHGSPTKERVQAG